MKTVAVLLVKRVYGSTDFTITSSSTWLQSLETNASHKPSQIYTKLRPRYNTSAFYCQSCIRGKAITAPKTENITSNIQKGTGFFGFFSRRASATGFALLSTAGACWAAGDGATVGFSWGSGSAGAFSICCCWLYFSTYSGNSFLKCGQFLLQNVQGQDFRELREWYLEHDLNYVQTKQGAKSKIY